MLQVIDLDFDYQEQPLLSGINFTVPSGGLLHLQGANGAGKTTLLKVLAGLYQPSLGHICYLGQPIQQQLHYYQRHLCFIGHKAGINPYLTLRENCLFDVHYNQSSCDVAALASIFKLAAYLDTPCGLLSAGQKRQVGLLRLWFSAATLWLLDEPFVALDNKTLELLMNKMQLHREQGGAIVLTSHQHLPLESSAYQDYFL